MTEDRVVSCVKVKRRNGRRRLAALLNLAISVKEENAHSATQPDGDASDNTVDAKAVIQGKLYPDDDGRRDDCRD